MSTLTPPLSLHDHHRGNIDAPASLVEFGDYECPFCGQAHPVVKTLQQALGEQLCFAFRHFPINAAHSHAALAAEAAEAAGAQGLFWPIHDMLYERQYALDLPSLEQYASLLGLDLEQFMGDLHAHRFLEKVRGDIHSGAMSGVSGTPTFFVNGRRHDGPHDFDSLYSAIIDVAGIGAYA